jgi:hypothetical protein
MLTTTSCTQRYLSFNLYRPLTMMATHKVDDGEVVAALWWNPASTGSTKLGTSFTRLLGR